MKSEILHALQGGLIVSCQAREGTPLSTPGVLAALAAAAELGGAAGIRANGPDNVAAITRAVRIPVIGIYKVECPNFEVYITPTFDAAQAIHVAGSPPPAIIAFDATARPRPHASPLKRLIRRIQTELGALAMADISTLEEGLAAAEAGADIVATTLSGYTSYTQDRKLTGGPDLDLLEALTTRLNTPVFCEGRVHSPTLARTAFDRGAFAVVVGTAITSIDYLTQTYVDQIKREPSVSP